MNEGPLCEEILVSVASPPPPPLVTWKTDMPKILNYFVRHHAHLLIYISVFCYYVAVYVCKKHFYDGTKPLHASSFLRLEQTQVDFLSTKRNKTINVRC